MWRIKASNFTALAIISLFVLFVCSSVYADDGSLGRTPDGVFPIQENDVEMESEEITVDLEKNSVECIFVFHNTGESKNIYMGFPGKLDKSMGGELTEDLNLELGHFKTFVKGKALPVIREKSVQPYNAETLDVSRYSEWFTFTVPFKADERVTVRNTYDFRPSYVSTGDVFTGYVLKTGALWKGSIGSAKVTFKLGKIQPYQVERLQPGGFKFIDNNLIWERNNFEPGYDLNLDYNTWHYSEEFLKDMAGDEGAKIKQKIENFNKVKELADKGGTDELLDLYDKAVNERDSILALYIRSNLPEGKIPDVMSALGNIIVENGNGGYHISCDIIGSDSALIKLRISHNENGNAIPDGEFDTPSCYISLTPGIEYTITCTLQDWMDRTVQKTLKYIVPEKAEVTTSDLAQSPISDAASFPTRKPESSLGIWSATLVVLFGFLAVSVVFLQKKKL